MGKTGAKLPGFCLNKLRLHVKVRSPTIQSKATEESPKADDSTDKNNPDKSVGEEKPKEEAKPMSIIGRKIMIVVDSSIESKRALQWALSHTVQSQDVVILLHVTKPCKQAINEGSIKERAPRAYELVSSLKNMCQLRRPEVQIEMTVVEGKDKGPSIVEEAKKQGVALLVLGQKKRSVAWRLLMMWVTNRSSGSLVEYCIQNADCMAIAVRRKNQKHGGYLITTKRHKDFWLLA